jgi:tRNA threonylcarbamoyladenosine biosynthesis protein TsaE
MTGEELLVWLCPGEDETRRAGRRLAPLLAPGSLVLISGELGAGKTLFVKGLAEGLGLDPEEVTSPTFALVHEYGGGLFHADLYRLPGEAIEDLGLEEAQRQGAVVVVEWPGERFHEEPAWRVEIEVLDGGVRRITAAR